MAKNTSIEARFSLNNSHLPQPIAESTSLNLNGCSWVNAPLSPQHRSNSNGCLIQTPKSLSRHATELPSARIDARTYTDIQSNGLTSRIVQYHNNKNVTRLNRSTSMNALYSRPGQFPVVHLKKTELPISASKRNQISMTRIAPPEKSLFYGNTLSGLLRSNSIVCGNQKNDRKFSHENRPIIHPPPTEDDTMPTRSVLDVLKEISRKRINSENDDGRMEATMKKYCNRECQEQVDSTIQLTTNQQQNLQQRTQFTNNNNYKRPREQLANSPNSKCRTPPVQTTNLSPEQTAKSRRLSNFNNDITSSLSSSQIYASKRKLYESPQGKKPLLTDEHELTTQRYKMPRQKLYTDIATGSMSCTDIGGSNYLPITPIPPTPQATIENNKISKNNVMEIGSVPIMRTMSTPVLVNKDMITTTTTTTTTTTPLKSKPRLTLFNKNYEIEEKQINHIKKGKIENRNNNDADEEEEDEDQNDDNSYAEIQFVKPKKGEMLSGSKHPLIQRTQKSKLALMLCGLRGELYQGDDISPSSTTISNPLISSTTTSVDEMDTLKTISANMNEKQEKTNNFVGISTSTPTTIQNIQIPEKQQPQQQQQQQQAVEQNTPNSKLISFQQMIPTSPAVETTPITTPTSIITTKKTTSPLVGIKLTPAKPMENNINITSISNDTNATTIAPITSIANINSTLASSFQFGVPTTTTTSSMPTLKLGSGTFNFTNNNNTMDKTSNAETVQSTNASQVSQINSFGVFNMPTTKLTTNTLDTTANVMPFSMTNSVVIAPTTTTTASALPFSNQQTTSANTTAGIPSPPYFAFGSEKSFANTNTNAVITKTTTASIVPAVTPALFAFGGSGGINVNNAAATTTIPTTTNTKGGFSFANSIANATKPNTNDASFSLNNSLAKNIDNNKSSGSLGGFNFSNINNNSNNNTNNNNNGFTFGSNSNTSISSSMFGTNTNMTKTATPALGFNTNNTVNNAAQIPSSSATMPTFNLFNNQTTITTTNPTTMTNFSLGADNKNDAKPAFTFGNTVTAAATTMNNNNIQNTNNQNNSNNSMNITNPTANLFSVATPMNNNNNNTNNNNNNNIQGILKSNFTFGQNNNINNNNNNNSNNNNNKIHLKW